LRQRVIAYQLNQMGATVTFQCGNIIGVNFSDESRNVSDDDLSVLRGATDLQWLHVEDTGVTVEGLLVAAKEHPHLDSISVMTHQLSTAEERQLRAVSPDVTVQRLHRASDRRKIVEGFE